MSDRRFPLAAMYPTIRSRWQPISQFVSTISDIGKTAEVLGVSRTTVHRWRDHGLTRVQADHAAGLLGVNPSAIWPDWFADVPVMLLKPDKRSLLPQPPYRPCGTPAAAKRHRRNGETLDEACRTAERLYLLPMQRAARARSQRLRR